MAAEQDPTTISKVDAPAHTGEPSQPQTSEPFMERDTQMSAFARWVAEQQQLGIETYSDLWQWSVADPGAFWSATRQFLQIPSSEPTGEVLSGLMPHAQWFAG